MMLQNADDSPGPQFCQLDSAQEKVVVGRSAKLGEEEHGWRIEARGDVPAAAVAKVSRRHCLVLRTERTEAAPLGWALKNISERNHITLFQQGKEQTLAPRTGPESKQVACYGLCEDDIVELAPMVRFQILYDGPQGGASDGEDDEAAAQAIFPALRPGLAVEVCSYEDEALAGAWFRGEVVTAGKAGATTDPFAKIEVRYQDLMAGDDAVVAEEEEGNLVEETALFGRAKIGRGKRTLAMVRRMLPMALQRRGGRRATGERVEVRRVVSSATIGSEYHFPQTCTDGLNSWTLCLALRCSWMTRGGRARCWRSRAAAADGKRLWCSSTRSPSARETRAFMTSPISDRSTRTSTGTTAGGLSGNLSEAARTRRRSSQPTWTMRSTSDRVVQLRA